MPHTFCVKFGSCIPLTVKVLLQTEYVIWLDFDKVKERFVGMRVFFENMNFIGGETLIFDHCGGFEYQVCICDMYGSKIHYPNTVHCFQACHPSIGMFFRCLVLDPCMT